MGVRTFQSGEFWTWRAEDDSVRVLFAGRGPSLGREEQARRLLPSGIEPAWLRQIHSRKIHVARPGANGEGDALVTDRRGLALTVVTADCVPVLFAAEKQLAAAHAGWRGLASRLLPATLERLGADGREVKAWIGPTIGPCCYEVGSDVAEEVAAASHENVIRPGSRGRPHLDLQEAAAAQLREHGVENVHRVTVCTRCAADRLWSYRRDGKAAGRNLAAIWREPGEESRS